MIEPILVVNTEGMEKEAADHWQTLNNGVRDIAALRMPVIAQRDKLHRKSRLVWKIRQYSNALVYRWVALAEGVAISWNARNDLSAFLNGRAMSETAAAYYDYSNQLGEYAPEKDFKAMDDLTMNRLFATRDEEFLTEHPELKAVQVLKVIDKIDKDLIPHFRSHYDAMSERCHPNARGSREMFSSIDYETADITFGPQRNDGDISSIRCALGTSVLMRLAWDKVESLVPQIAEDHHAAHPSPIVHEDEVED